jgi:DNA-binding transcriptional regulator YhcF (GntR family)
VQRQGPIVDDELIRSWENSASTPMNIAADVAIGIREGRIRAVPSTGEVAREWDTSPRTVQRAKKLLEDHGIIKRDAAGYYLP